MTVDNQPDPMRQEREVETPLEGEASTECESLMTNESTEWASADEIRSRVPRFAAENLSANQAIVDRVRALADERGATPAQVALVWLLAQQPFIVPIPGTRRRERLDENAGSTSLALSADDIAHLDALLVEVGVAGNRYDEAGMAAVGL